MNFKGEWYHFCRDLYKKCVKYLTLLIKKFSTDFKDIIQKNIIENHGLNFYCIGPNQL